MQLVFELMHLDNIQRLHDQQSVDKETVTLMGRYAASRSMGTCDKPHFLKVCHYVTYGGRTQIKAGKFGKRTRPDWLTFPYIAFNQGF